MTAVSCPYCGMPYSESAIIELCGEGEHEELRKLALAVVDQDCGTPDGEAAFEDALHQLWLALHTQGETR